MSQPFSSFSIRGIIRMFLITGVIVFSVRYFLFKPFTVEGRSMQPNFQDHQYLIIDEVSYRFKDPERGEVVVFKQHFEKEDLFLIKRVIGLPGERVKVVEGKITIYNDTHPNGMLLNESYLPQDFLTSGEENITLAEDQYFVLGDNRSISKDSRYFGPIEKLQIVGKVFLRGWPLDEVQIFKTPEFNY